MERLLVVGGGTMGAGIALVAAQAGYAVEIAEPQAAARERGKAYLEREAQRIGDRSAVERIRWSDAIPSQSDAAIALEAVPERFELKRDVFVALANALAPDALLATNTSSLSVEQLADVVAHPERVVGLHFFNPATTNGVARNRACAADRRRGAGTCLRRRRTLRQNAGARGRYAGLHRQSHRPAVLSSSAARAGTRRRLRRRARCARARGRLSNGSLRVDGFNRARRQSRDDGVDLRPHRAGAIRAG